MTSNYQPAAYGGPDDNGQPWMVSRRSRIERPPIQINPTGKALTVSTVPRPPGAGLIDECDHCHLRIGVRYRGDPARLASHAPRKGTRYCATAPKISDPRTLAPGPSSPSGRTLCACQPRPLGTTDYSFRPAEHCLHSYHRAACAVEWSTSISEPAVERLPTSSRSCKDR